MPLSDKDVNAPVGNPDQQQAGEVKPTADVKSMEYHRQMLHDKMAQEKYVNENSPANQQDRKSGNRNRNGYGYGNGDDHDRNGIIRRRPPGKGEIIQPVSKSTSTSAPTFALASTSAPPHSSMSQQQYISPSDNIMSPCTAKLTALRNKQMGKAKPKSLFAQTSSKKLEGGNAGGLFGVKPLPKSKDNA